MYLPSVAQMTLVMGGYGRNKCIMYTAIALTHNSSRPVYRTSLVQMDRSDSESFESTSTGATTEVALFGHTIYNRQGSLSMELPYIVGVSSVFYTIFH